MKRQFSTALALSLATAIQLGAADLYVSAEPSVENSCTSKETACDFQTALDKARTNTEADTIHAASGFYNISSRLDYIPGSGDDNSALTILGSEAEPTILDGGNSNHIMWISTSILSDDSEADITIRDITFLNGKTDDDGGGLHADAHSADITVNDSNFSGNNSLHWNGGGASISSDFGNVTLVNNNFRGNNSHYWYGGGAAVYTDDGNITLNNNTFSGNTANESGGGVFAHSLRAGNITLNNNTFSDNIAASGYGAGGGAYAYTIGGNVSLTNNILSSNYADIIGGGTYILAYDGNISLTNNTIIGNTANEIGGGGGGVFIDWIADSAIVEIYNNIIWGNNVTGVTNRGEDLYVLNSNLSEIKLYSNNLGLDANFTTGKSEDLYIASTNGYDPYHNYQVDPLFVDAASGDFHLSESSPLIDLGNSCCHTLPATDFEGDNRIIDGDGDGLAYPDVGADEYDPDQSAQPVITVDPGNLNFGDVIVGNSKVESVTVHNGGDTDLQSGIGYIVFSGANASEFSQTNDCATIVSGDYCTVTVTFAPTLSGSKSAELIITAENEYGTSVTDAVSLTGNAKTPEEQSDDIIEFIEDSVESGDLVGTGPGNSANKRINAMEEMIDDAKQLIEDGYISEACIQLESAYKKTDGAPNPPDFVEGEDAEDLANMIQELMNSIDCSLQ